VRLAFVPVALLALCLVPAGCGAGEGDAGAGTPVAPVAGVPAPAVGRTLERLVEAAGRGDADAMWAVLSPQTRATMGPTRAEFGRGLALDLRNGPGTLAGGGRVVLAVRLGRWGLATVAGERVAGGEREAYAYAAAFRLVGGAWRAELGGAAPGALEPSPLAETDATPTVAGRMDGSGPVEQALLWLDAEPQRVLRRPGGPFSARLVADPAPGPLAPGRHVVTLFAATPDTAAAYAWPFEVAEG
jgi:hypothetical protein